MFFVAVKNEGGRRRNEGVEDKGCSSDHKLNIINGLLIDLIEKFKPVSD